MTKHRQLLEGARLPQDFLDSINEFLGSQASPNFQIKIQTGTSLRVAAGTDNDQVAIAINGKWRWNTANADAAAPGGLTVGANPVFVAASANSFGANPTPPPTELDSTDYSFRLIVKPVGATPSGAGAEALWRQVGTVVWSGTAFTEVRQTVGMASPSNIAIAGAILSFGTLASRPAAASGNTNFYYFATDVGAGTLYQSNGSAWFQVAASVGVNVNTQAGSYALVLADAGKLVEMNVATANTLTVPTDASVAFPIGTTITVSQLGAGQTTITPAGGVTIRSIPGLKLVGQNAMAALVKRAANDWYAAGNLSA